ncbi:nucleotide-binding universal stress UspA family protein [Humibacillus xanthopallidus]|uniref:Nucleotide-binding universal stress UspA family protein n=1 Tax=Humibacillus xanthopallidus TaxID=412689 RepID=A0A543PTU0_9MICO|nr:universal stress protein [Humibacillus xanthopallidus]TQN47466.1 nucleotide-binding universal stress UspA family protein [Humibacillus xanthopallidus]
MTIVVAYTAQDSGRSALELASVLSRSTGEPLLVAVVVTTPHAAGAPEFVDGNYLGPMTDWGSSVLDQARANLPGDIAATFVVRQASSIPRGLLELAEESGASAVVLGSSSKGSLGRISLGSVTDRLVHSAPLPVVLAPLGYRAGPASRIRRVSIGYGGSKDLAHTAEAGAGLAETVGASLRVVSFAVRPPKRLYGGVEESADELVVDRWVVRMKEELVTQLTAADAGRLGDRLARSLVVAEGATWSQAVWGVDWNDGDLLVVGPSSSAPAARLFLGSRASKIVRSAPVPVYLVPSSRSH